jgi:hypothetical protein
VRQLVECPHGVLANKAMGLLAQHALEFDVVRIPHVSKHDRRVPLENPEASPGSSATY